MTTTFTIHKATSRSGAPIESEWITRTREPNFFEGHHFLAEIADKAATAGARVEWQGRSRVTITTGHKPGLSSAPELAITYQIWSFPMRPIELQARREALGLSQSALGALLGNSQATIARWEAGQRAIPDVLDEELAQQEEIVEQILERAEDLLDEADGEPVEFRVYAADAELWAAHPEMMGVPAVLHRVAMARARALADGPCRITGG